MRALTAQAQLPGRSCRVLAHRNHVFFFVLATLAYFHVLSAIKNSSFFAPTTLPPLRLSHALWRSNEWVNIPESEWKDALDHPSTRAASIDLQHLVMSFDARTAKKVRTTLFCISCIN